MDKQQIYNEIKEILQYEKEKDVETFESTIKMDAPMKDHTSFKVGGPADLLIDPGDRKRLYAVIRFLKNKNVPFIIFGNGTNIIIRDGGYRGVVVMMRSEIEGAPMMGETSSDPNMKNVITADAGMLLSSFAKIAAMEGLSGLEPLSGIPGTIGGAVFMNAGAYGGEIKDVIRSVTAYDPQMDKIASIEKENMELSYRHSAFQNNGKIILDATFELSNGDEEKITETMRDLTKKRNAKQPVNMPSAGSFFKRPEGHYAGKLIEDAGLKGLKKGGAQISELHSGFMVNAGDATAQDIEDLMQVVRTTVFDKYSVMMEPEVKIIGEPI